VHYLQRRTLSVVALMLWIMVVGGSGAVGDMLFDAPLRDGDYGAGSEIDTMDPDHGGSPHVLGIVDSSDGVTRQPCRPCGNGRLGGSLG
jgi:hypothetical protein